MRKIPYILFLWLLVSGLHSSAQTLIHYWHFNNFTGISSATNPANLVPYRADFSLMDTAKVKVAFRTLPGTSASYTTYWDGATTGDTTNSRQGAAAGSYLRSRNPSDSMQLLFYIPTTGFSNPVFKYTVQKSSAGNGASVNYFSYSIDSGTTWLSSGMSVDSFITNAAWTTAPVSIQINNPLAANNPKLVFRIIFGGPGHTGTSGNNRIDNVSLDGTPIPSNILLHYWHFNNFTGVSSATNPNNLLPYRADFTLLDTAKVKVAFRTLPGTSSSYTTYWDGATTGDTTNARQGAAAGSYLRPRNPSDSMQLQFYIPTTGYSNPLIKYTVQKSSAGNGASINYFSYSIDSGATWMTSGMSVDSFVTNAAWTTSPVAIQISNPAASNNPQLVFRIRFGGPGHTGTSGNNRIDNFSVDASASSSGGNMTDSLPPSVSFNPAHNATDVATNIQPQLTFNENIRLLNNTAINNTNVDALVELRLNDSSGSAVSFDATIAGNVITITPASALANNQAYYYSIKAGVIEDSSNNMLSIRKGAVLTTAALQTQFNPGDLVPVAYRMNALNTDDEVAFLTFVNILPGTKINLTDAKFTNNTPAQCPGGLIWTAPASGVAAGTVISIKNDLGTASTGSLSGGNFGLSSGGDQCMVYTGANASPAFITALSSNAWLSANTTCSGSNSMRPPALSDGTSSIQFSTTKGHVSGNTANACYTGTQTGSVAQLRAAILDTVNWNGAASGTAPQTWPVWSFPGPPAIVHAVIVNATTIRLVFSEDLDNTTATATGNFTGVAGLSGVIRSNNGGLADTLLLHYSSAFNSGSSYTLSVSGVKDAGGVTMFSTYTFSFTYHTTISFSGEFASVKEDTGTYTLNLTLSNPSSSSVNLVVKGSPYSTASASDYTLSTQTLTFTGASNSSQTISIPINNDALNEQDEYIVLSLETPSGLSISGTSYFTLFIRDNDRTAPVARKGLELKYVGSFDPSPSAGSTTEIVVYDSTSKRLFMTSAIQNRLDIASFAKPDSIYLIKSINMSSYGGITSVAVRNGLVAVASPNANPQLSGYVVFFNTNGDSLKRVNVGVLPDMITFTPDGKKVLTANEGQPNDAYTVDPEGSISVIDLSGGISSLAQSNVTTLGFTAFNSQDSALRAQGVRKLKLSSTLSQDFEPEYVAVSADSKKAWATLQENNAIAEIDLVSNTITSVWPMGQKDYNSMGNGFDASDNSGFVHLSNYPVKAFYIPDAIANYTVGGQNYLVTANEGDEKEYGGLNERTTVGASSTLLDPAAFPNAAVLKQNHHIGRLRMTSLSGDKDGDGDYDEIHVAGSRSFTIWNATNRNKVYDSGDDFERITSTDPSIAVQFNADNEGNGMKSRSRAKGPEPEGLTIAQIDGKQFAFIALERVGGVMVYDISDPANPVYQDYKNSRSLSSYGGDHGPEGITYISPKQSPDGKAYITVANEISGTVSVYEVKNNMPRTLRFASPSASYSEGSNTQAVELSLDHPLTAAGSITLKVIHGTGTTSGDYQISPALTGDSLIIPVSMNSDKAIFYIAAIDDIVDENDETITFQISKAPANVNIGAGGTFALTIADNDVSQAVNFSSSALNVMENAGSAAVQINLGGPMQGNGLIVLKLNRGSNVTAADFSIVGLSANDSILLPVSNGDIAVAFDVNIMDDVSDESDETLSFSIARVQGNLLGALPSSLTLTIKDNDLTIGTGKALDQQKDILMFPNPNRNGILYFSQAVDAELYDMQGRLLMKTSSKTTEMNIENLPEGIYMVRLEGKENRKLIIN